MSWKDFADFDMLLQIIKTVIFVGGIVFATSYLMPKGIIAFEKWKETKKQSDLAISINFCAIAIMLLMFFLSTMIVSCVKSFFG